MSASVSIARRIILLSPTYLISKLSRRHRTRQYVQKISRRFLKFLWLNCFGSHAFLSRVVKHSMFDVPALDPVLLEAVRQSCSGSTAAGEQSTLDYTSDESKRDEQ